MPLYILAALVLIGLDQAVKYWALTSLQAQHTIPLIENVFHLTYVENRGAAFSLFAQFDSRWIFVTLACIITVVILVVLQKKLMQTALGRWLRAHWEMRSTVLCTALSSICSTSA